MKETNFNIGDLVFGIYNYRFYLWRVEQVITTTIQSEYETTMKSEYICQMVTDEENTMYNTFDEDDLYTKRQFTDLYNYLIGEYEEKEKS